MPTPRSHYDTFKPGTSGLPLLLDLLKQLDPETQKVLLRLAMASGVHDIGADPELATAAAKQPRMPKEQAIALIKQTISSADRPLLLEFFLHESHVLQMIPEKWGSIWAPIVHDALLYFLDHLSDDRLFDKLVSLAYLPQGTSPVATTSKNSCRKSPACRSCVRFWPEIPIWLPTTDSRSRIWKTAFIR